MSGKETTFPDTFPLLKSGKIVYIHHIWSTLGIERGDHYDVPVHDFG